MKVLISEYDLLDLYLNDALAEKLVEMGWEYDENKSLEENRKSNKLILKLTKINEYSFNTDIESYPHSKLEKILRTHPDIIKLHENGELINFLNYNNDVELKVVKIPDDVDWYIEKNYGDCGMKGNEEIHEVHRVWS